MPVSYVGRLVEQVEFVIVKLVLLLQVQELTEVAIEMKVDRQHMGDL